MIKVAMIGFGGIAQAHRYAYWKLNREGFPVRLIAACDTDLEKFKKITQINIPLKCEFLDELPFNIYDNYRIMLEKEKPDVVDICLPTKFHESIASEALSMGFSVLCEKPMAENFEGCNKILSELQKSKGALMIAQCVRFQPEYEYLQKAINENLYGKILSAEFYRYTGFPNWSKGNWRGEADKIGSCLFDLNIHDVDVVASFFGKPEKISCIVQNVKYPFDRSESMFYYTDFKVKINGAWLEINEPFDPGYSVVFEKGTLSFKNGIVSYTDNFGKKEIIEIPDNDMITEEIRYFIEILENKLMNERNAPEDSAKTIYMLEKLFESAEKNGAIIELEDF